MNPPSSQSSSESHPAPAQQKEPAAATRVPWRSPIIETGLFVALVLVADAVWGPGDRFIHVQLHPFWAIVLFMAVQYGTAQALMATGISSVALLLGNMPLQTFDQDVHAYALQVLMRPLLWMVASVLFGELRVRHRLQYVDTVDRLRNAERRVALLSKAHGDVTSAKERLETRLAGQLRTATGMFEAARALETLDPNKVLEGTTELLNVALNAKAFSLWLLNGDALVLVAAQGVNQGKELAKRYTATNRLFQEVVGAQRVVSVATAEGEAVLEGQGLMAGPLIDPAGGKLFGMLKIEDMSFLDFNLSSLHTFKAMCEWVGTAYANAVTHETSQIEDERTQLYGAKYLDRQTKYLTEVALRFGFDLTLVYLRVDVSDWSEDERRALPAIMGHVSQKYLRRTDLVFNHEVSATQYAVLLPGAPAEGAVVAARKLVNVLRQACGREVICTTQVRALCQAGESASRQALRAIASDRVA